MMSYAHIGIGIGTAFAVTQPQTPQGCILALIGGAIGGVLPDIDILDHDNTGDAILGQSIAFGGTAILLLIDYLADIGIFESIISHDYRVLIGTSIFLLIMLVIGFFQEHRGFTHSLLAMILYSIPFIVYFWPIVFCIIPAFLSHLIIDMFNHTDIRLLFPSEFEISFGLCYADGIASILLAGIGFVATIVFLINGLFVHHEFWSTLAQEFCRGIYI